MKWEISKRLTAGIVGSVGIALLIHFFAYISISHLVKESRNSINSHESAKREFLADAHKTNVLIVVGSAASVLLMVTVLILLNHQMSRRKQAEHSLMIAEERVRLAITGAQIGTWHIDLKNGLFNWSETFRRMLGIAESTAPSLEAFVNALHPEDRDIAFARSKSVLDGEAEITCTYSEYRIPQSDGSIRWINTRGTIYRDESGEPLRMEGIAQDITERKKSEQEIRQLNAELQNQISHVQELNQEMEAFTYSVSHDLRAPLRHIHGFVQLLKKDQKIVLNEKSAHYLNVIEQAATSMSKLIDDLLALSRTGRTELRKHPVNLESMVSDLVQRFQNDLAGRKVEWKIGKLPEVHADSGLIKIVLDNLISNAVKYTRPREVAKIEIDSTENGSYTVFYVRDNGVGFEMKYVNKLFGAFQRLHSHEEFEGTGVGLATVRRIVNRHDGQVWAESEIGSGSTFYFTLPKQGASNEV